MLLIRRTPRPAAGKPRSVPQRGYWRKRVRVESAIQPKQNNLQRTDGLQST
jgi:hypothetical protein